VTFLTIVSQVPIVMPLISYRAIGSDIILFGAALLVLLLSAVMGRKEHVIFYQLVGIIAGIGSAAWSGYMLDQVIRHGSSLVIAGSVSLDGFSCVIGIVVGAVVALSLMIAPEFISEVAGGGPEFVALTLISALGASVMAQGEDLLVIFLGLEILSIALYVMVAYRSGDRLGREAALKYFLLGGFSSAIFLYGIALVYGATGSTNLAKIATYLASTVIIHDGLLLFGIALILVGFGFKISSVPFHIWAPDVYQGAPTSTTGYMAAMAKIGGFAALLRVLVVAFPMQVHDWRVFVGGFAVLSIVFGALFALRQTDIKRVLAYSSINQAGFILLGVYANTKAGVSDALYYIVVYSIAVVATFGVISIIQRSLGKTEGTLSYDDIKGFARRYPLAGITLAVLILSQAGAPFTTGFIAKFSVLTAVIGVGGYWIGAVAMVGAAIALAFYLRIILTMYRRDETADLAPAVSGGADDDSMVSVVPLRVTPTTAIGLTLAVAFTVFFGVFVTPLVALCVHGTILH